MITLTETTTRPNTSVKFWISPSDFLQSSEDQFYSTGKVISSKFWYTDELTRIRVTEYQSKNAVVEFSEYFNTYDSGNLAANKKAYDSEKGITITVVTDPPW